MTIFLRPLTSTYVTAFLYFSGRNFVSESSVSYRWLSASKTDTSVRAGEVAAIAVPLLSDENDVLRPESTSSERPMPAFGATHGETGAESGPRTSASCWPSSGAGAY